MNAIAQDAEVREHFRQRMPYLLECVREIAHTIDDGASETGRELSWHVGAALAAAYRLRAEAAPQAQ